MKTYNSTNGTLLQACLTVSAIAMGAAAFTGAQVSAQQTVTLPSGAVNVALPGYGQSYNAIPTPFNPNNFAFGGGYQGDQIPAYSPVTLSGQSAGFGAPVFGGRPDNLQASAYTGPVYSLPSVNAGQQLQAETLNGPIVTSLNTPLPPSYPVIQSVVAPRVAPPVVNTAKPTVYRRTERPYFLIKGMTQDAKPFVWNAFTANTGDVHLTTDTKKGETILAAIGTPFKTALPVSGLFAEAELGYRTSDIRTMKPGSGIVTNTAGGVRILSGALNLVKEFNGSGRFGGYLGAGFGAAEIEHKQVSGLYKTSAAAITGTDIGITQDDDMAFMSNIFAGLEFAVSPKVKLVAEIRQVNFSDIDRNADSGNELEHSYAIREGGLGLKFKF